MEMNTEEKKMSLQPKVMKIIEEQLGVDPDRVKPESSFIDPNEFYAPNMPELRHHSALPFSACEN